LRRYAPAAFVVAVTLVHLSIAVQSVGPMYLYDEVGYLAGANVLSGSGDTWSLCGSSYAVGYSAILAPLWWLPVSPLVTYQIAAYISAALGAAVMWPASALARRYGVTGFAALAIGALVTLVPARALMDNYVIAENPLTLLIVTGALLAWRIAERNVARDYWLFGAVLGLAAVVHARAIPLVGVAMAWLVVRWLVHKSSTLVTLGSAALAGVLALLGLWGQREMGARVFATDDRVSDLVGSVTPAGVGEVVLGQGFSQVVSWSLFTALGLLACLARARHTFRSRGHRALANPWWWLGAGVIAQALFFVYVLAASVDLHTRLDIPVFGRYLDPFVVPMAVLGAATLWRRRSRMVTVAMVASIAIVVTYAAIVVPRVHLEAKWIPFAVPGLWPFLDPLSGDDRPALLVAAAAAAVGCVALWVLARWPRVWLASVLGVATAVTLWADAVRVDPFEAPVRAASTVVTIAESNPDHPLALVADLLSCADRNKLQFELAGRAQVVLSDEVLGTDYVLGPANWPEAEEQGWVPFPYSMWQNSRIWVVEP